MKYYIGKLLGIPLLVMFMDLAFILFAREVLTQLHTLVPILLLNIFISIDIVIRPVSAKKDKFNRCIIAISFLSMPIVFILPYYEYKTITNQILSPLIFNVVSIISIVLLALGGMTLLLSRIQLGEYGGPKIVIEDEHKLITTGLYQFIRHPMYLGFLLLFFGYSLAFGSFVMTIVISSTFFLIFKNRMDIEERLLISEFGEEYLRYMEGTKRLFPFLY
ncbi:MAG: methyltransferase family protein [Candidatus Hodarchaeota archaeon]